MTPRSTEDQSKTTDGGANLGATGVPARKSERDLGQARAVLQGWFARMHPEAQDVRVGEVRTPTSSGVANETLLCDASWTDGATQTSGRFVVRVNSPNFLYKDVDLAVHTGMYETLRDEPGIPVPAVVGYEADPSVLGEPFFVMEHIEGRVPSDAPPFHTEGWVAELPTESRAAMWRDAVAVMSRLHAVDPARIPFLDRPSLGSSGLEQDLRASLGYGRWIARGRALPVIDATATWLVDHLPRSPGTGLAWGDARVGNMIFQDDCVVAVLDWDMVSLAGAESDLAWWTIMDLMYTTSAGVERLPGIGGPTETIALWEELAGRPARDLHFHLVSGAYRMATILVRLADLLAEAGVLPPDLAADMVANNTAIQYLATMLDLPHDGPIVTPWPGLDG